MGFEDWLGAYLGHEYDNIIFLNHQIFHTYPR